MLTIWSKVKAILQAPITEDLDYGQLALITGVVMISFIGWLIVLKYAKAGVSTIAGEV